MAFCVPSAYLLGGTEQLWVSLPEPGLDQMDPEVPSNLSYCHRSQTSADHRIIVCFGLKGILNISQFQHPSMSWLSFTS